MPVVSPVQASVRAPAPKGLLASARLLRHKRLPTFHSASRQLGGEADEDGDASASYSGRRGGSVVMRAANIAMAITAFPGEDAPGTGHRKFPAQPEPPKEPAKQSDFAFKTTEQCYEEFPVLAKASCPLEVVDREPAGVSVQRAADGPGTGARRPPSPIDEDDAADADDPIPCHPQSVEARLVELHVRRGAC